MSFLTKTILLAMALVITLSCLAYSEQFQPIVKADEITVQPEPIIPVELTPVEYADKYALQYGIDAGVFKKVMWCESNYLPEAVGDNGKARNVMQYHKDTFIGDAKAMGENLNYDSYHDQIKAAAWSFTQGESYKRRWTSYRAIMNGGVYTFYSSSLDQWFTVNCKL